MTEPAPREAPTPPDHDEPSQTIRHANNTAEALKALSAIAPGLTGVELHLALELTRRALATGEISVKASSRELAKSMHCGRSNVVRAIDALTAHNHIATRARAGHEGAVYRLRFLEVTRLSGPVSGPLPAAPVLFQDRSPVLFQDHPGPESGPPPPENTALIEAAAALDVSTASLVMIDRVFSATAKNFDRATLTTFRDWLHGYMQRFGRDERNQPTPHALPPSDTQVAQLLTIAEPDRIGRFLYTLMQEKRTCHSYTWFVAVAIQRLAGVHWKEQQKAHAALAVVRRAGKPAAPIAAPATPDAGNLFDQLAATADRKRFR